MQYESDHGSDGVMNGIEVATILQKFPQIAKKTIICTANNIPKILQLKTFLIINTVNKLKPNNHWFVLHYYSLYEIEFFDSVRSISNSDLKKFSFGIENILVNKHTYQPFNTTTCGSLCLYFVISRCDNKNSYNSFLENNFPQNYKKLIRKVKIFLAKNGAQMSIKTVDFPSTN